MKLSELTNNELLEKAWNEISALCGSKGPRKEWRMTVPVDEKNDSDVLFGEVLKRFAQLEAENERLQEFWKQLCWQMWECWEMDYDFFHEWGLKLGLLKEVPYDPEVHGELDAEEGDTILINALKAGEE